MSAQLPSDFAVAVRDERARRGWTQSDVAARAGITRQLVARIESAPGGVSFERVLRVLAALDIVPTLSTPAPSEGAEDAHDLFSALDKARSIALLGRSTPTFHFGPGPLPGSLTHLAVELAQRKADDARAITDGGIDHEG